MAGRRSEPVEPQGRTGRPLDGQARRPLSGTVHNLPIELTSFIGRERAIAEPRTRLDDTCSPPAGRSATSESESVRLFADRARLSHADFQLTSRNAPQVAAICQHLDGMPLAIELAAARLGSLGLDQVLEHLADRLRLLTEGNRAAAPRQRTLKATLDWSAGNNDLLSQAEKALFCRLSVFAGGFTPEAAEAVGEGGVVPGGRQGRMDVAFGILDYFEGRYASARLGYRHVWRGSAASV